jgi:hypothetical protein
LIRFDVERNSLNLQARIRKHNLGGGAIFDRVVQKFKVQRFKVFPSLTLNFEPGTLNEKDGKWS